MLLLASNFAAAKVLSALLQVRYRLECLRKVRALTGTKFRRISPSRVGVILVSGSCDGIPFKGSHLDARNSLRRWLVLFTKLLRSAIVVL